MRIFIPILIYFVILSSIIFPQDEENYESSDFYVEEYLETDYKPDYEQVFTSEADRTNFKKLREYLKNKEFIREKLYRLKQELVYDISDSKYELKLIEGKIPEIENKIAGKSENEMVYVDVYSPSNSLNFFGDYGVKVIKNSILPQLKEIKSKAAKERVLRSKRFSRYS